MAFRLLCLILSNQCQSRHQPIHFLIVAIVDTVVAYIYDLVSYITN